MDHELRLKRFGLCGSSIPAAKCKDKLSGLLTSCAFPDNNYGIVAPQASLVCEMLLIYGAEQNIKQRL
jgi:hypothetical protein